MSPEVAEVWIEMSTGEQIETSLVSLAEAGLDCDAFVGFAPQNVTISSVVAIDADGRVLEVWDAPAIGR